MEEISEGLITAYANKFSNRVIQSIDIEHFITEFLMLRIEYLADTKGIFKGKDRKALTERHSERVRKNRRYGISHAAAYIKILFEF